jgi:hypothetical protein
VITTPSGTIVEVPDPNAAPVIVWHNDATRVLADMHIQSNGFVR